MATSRINLLANIVSDGNFIEKMYMFLKEDDLYETSNFQLTMRKYSCLSAKQWPIRDPLRRNFNSFLAKRKITKWLNCELWTDKIDILKVVKIREIYAEVAVKCVVTRTSIDWPSIPWTYESDEWIYLLTLCSDSSFDIKHTALAQKDANERVEAWIQLWLRPSCT